MLSRSDASAVLAPMARGAAFLGAMGAVALAFTLSSPRVETGSPSPASEAARTVPAGETRSASLDDSQWDGLLAARHAYFAALDARRTTRLAALD